MSDDQIGELHREAWEAGYRQGMAEPAIDERVLARALFDFHGAKYPIEEHRMEVAFIVHRFEYERLKRS